MIINKFYGTNILRLIQAQGCNKISRLSIVIVKDCERSPPGELDECVTKLQWIGEIKQVGF